MTLRCIDFFPSDSYQMDINRHIREESITAHTERLQSRRLIYVFNISLVGESTRRSEKHVLPPGFSQVQEVPAVCWESRDFTAVCRSYRCTTDCMIFKRWIYIYTYSCSYIFIWYIIAGFQDTYQHSVLWKITGRDVAQMKLHGWIKVRKCCAASTIPRVKPKKSTHDVC